MNFADFALFRFPADFGGFAHFIRWCLGSAFEIIFIVIVLNVAFSVLRGIVLQLAGVKKS